MNGTDHVSKDDLTVEELAALARLTGLDITPERLSAVAETVRSLRTRAVELEAVDLTRFEPAMRFDARWPEEKG